MPKSNKKASSTSGDAAGTKGSRLLSRDTALKVAFVVIAGTGIALIASYLLDDPSLSNFSDLEVVCVRDQDDLHGFVVPRDDFIRHLRSRTPIECPECGSIEIARATPCVSCAKLMPTGDHDLPPDNCPYCDAEQPYPTIGDHASMHAPGSHGEDQIIVPLLEEIKSE